MKPKPSAKKKAIPGSKNVYYDLVNPGKMALPKKLKDFFGDTSLADTTSALARMLTKFRGIGNWNPYVKTIETMSCLELALNNISNAIPFAVCRNEGCQGNGCDRCHGKGWWPKWKYEEWLQEQQARAQIEGYVIEEAAANADALMAEQAEGDLSEMFSDESACQDPQTDADQLEE
jgi:hypothetical protein